MVRETSGNFQKSAHSRRAAWFVGACSRPPRSRIRLELEPSGPDDVVDQVVEHADDYVVVFIEMAGPCPDVAARRVDDGVRRKVAL